MPRWKLSRPSGCPSWWIEWIDDTGSQGALDTGLADFNAATELAPGLVESALGSARLSAHPPPHAAHTVDDAVNRLAEVGLLDNAEGTVKCYAQRGGHLVRLLGPVEVSALSLDGLQEYICARLEEGAARETIRKELTVLRQALKLARKRGLFLGDCSELFPDFEARYSPRTGWLKPEQLAALLGKLPQVRQCWVLVAVYTGARRSEVEGLDWRDIDFSKNEVRIRGNKTAGSFRAMPLHPVLHAGLRPRAIAGQVVEHWHNIGRDLPAACKAAGVPRITANDLRRTFASWLVQSGESNFVVSRLLGHTTTKMVDLVYGQLSAETLRAAIAKLPSPPR